MKFNQILLGLFLVLLIPTGLKFFSGGVDYIAIDESQMMFQGFVKDNIAQIQISKPKLGDDGQPVLGQDGKPQLDQIAFARKDNEWRLLSGIYPSILKVRGTDVTTRIFDVIPKILVNQSTVIRSEATEADFKEFGLDEKQVTTVACFDAASKLIATLLVGRKSGGDAGEQATSGTYVCEAKKKVIVLCDEVIDLDTDEAVWVEKNLQDIPDGDILEISVKNQHGLVHFKREASNKDWTVVEGPKDVGALRKDQVTNLMTRAKYVSAQEFVSPRGADHGLEPPATPVFEITVVTKDEKRHVLKIGKKIDGKTEYYATSSAAGGVLFTMAEWDVTAYDKPPKDFFDPKPGAKDDKAGDKKGDGTGGKEGDKKAGGDPNKDAKKVDGGQGTGNKDAPTKSGPDKKSDDVKKDDVKKDDSKKGDPKKGGQ